MDSTLRKRAKWEVLTGWGDDAIEEESDDEQRPMTDGDILGDVTRRNRKEIVGAELPYERRWEMDPTAFKAGTVSAIVWCTSVMLILF